MEIRAGLGFTLIETLITLVIMATLAGIALPNYYSYHDQRVQRQARQQSLHIANQLAAWRGKTLSYQNFVAQQQSKQGAAIYIPSGSDEHTYRYKMTLDVSGATLWQLIAQPNEQHQRTAHLPVYYMDSLGQRCRFNHSLKAVTLKQLYNVGERCQALQAQPW